MTNNGEATVINDRYEVHKRIGRGGMADVFSARDLLLDRQVAIKVLFPEFATDDNFVERFRREAQSAANLSHPNIVNVYDWGKYEGTYFIAMEEVQGRTLADVLRSSGQLTSKQAAEIASEVAAALGFAHEKGTAHRDIKPANILIGTNGQVKVADFGIARAMNAPTESNLTQVGSVMGTATYFSPEQAQGAQPDPRSDLYSLGVVMYEMVAGRPPFTGDNPVSIAYKQVHDSPQPLVQIVADVPKGYEAMVAKLLAKDPRVRYPSAGALRDDLRRFRSDEPVQALVAAANKQQTQKESAAAAIATQAQTAIPINDVSPVDPQASAVPSTGMYEAGYPTGASAEAAYYDASSSRTGWYALAAFISLMALVVGGVLLFQALSGETEQSEPTTLVLADYTERELSVVTAELAELNIDVEPIAEENANVPVGFVHRTDPPADTVVLANQTVQIFYNPNPQLILIPQVEGLSIEDARAILAEQGLTIGTVSADDTSDRAEGTVLSSDPTAETPVPQGTTVDLVVSAPPTSVPVPGVIAFTETQALELLQNPPYEFEVTVEQIASETVPAGQVISIDPAQSALVERGGAVTIQVSSGPAPVVVPAVEGVTQGTAVNTLNSAGLVPVTELQVVEAGSPNDGRVISQSPASGASVPNGTTVTIVVGQAVERATTLPIQTAPPQTDPPVTDPVDTTEPEVTVSPQPTDPPATTEAPTTTEAPATTAAPTTTEAPTTTAAPDPGEAPPDPGDGDAGDGAGG